jgi:hypothetical protein
MLLRDLLDHSYKEHWRSWWSCVGECFSSHYCIYMVLCNSTVVDFVASFLLSAWFWELSPVTIMLGKNYSPTPMVPG